MTTFLRSLVLGATPRRAALLGCSTLCGGAAIVHATRSTAVSASAAATDKELNDMWAAAVDGWINVPGCESLTTDEGVLYMAPKADAAARPIPRLVAKSTIFSLTAWNPMGKDAPYATNEAQNEYLARDLTKLRPEPRAVWQAFGFHVNEGWRENGFSVAFANEERVFGRKSILKLARKYRQAAIYVYHFEPAPEGAGRDNNGYIVRELLWVGEDYGKIDEKDSTRMQILAAPPKTPLAAQEWRPAE